MTSVRIAIPNKGRLNQSAIRLMNKIGFPVPEAANRTLLAEFSKGRYQVLLARAQDIPEFVELGAADLGITGLDLISETGRNVESVMPLDFGRCRLVVAVPEDSGIKRAEDVKDGSTVATTFPNLTRAICSSTWKEIPWRTRVSSTSSAFICSTARNLSI